MVKIEDLDAHRSYRVFARNREYSGISFGVRFGGGQAIVHGLDADASEARIAGRLNQLRAFLNAEPVLKQAQSGEWRAYRPYILREEKSVQMANPFDEFEAQQPRAVDPDAEFRVPYADDEDEQVAETPDDAVTGTDAGTEKQSRSRSKAVA